MSKRSTTRRGLVLASPSTMFALGFGALVCFVIAYMSLAIGVARAILYGPPLR